MFQHFFMSSSDTLQPKPCQVTPVPKLAAVEKYDLYNYDVSPEISYVNSQIVAVKSRFYKIIINCDVLKYK